MNKCWRPPTDHIIEDTFVSQASYFTDITEIDTTEQEIQMGGTYNIDNALFYEERQISH